MINFIKQAVESVEGIKSFLFNTDYRNNFDLQNVKFPCCVLTPIMRTNYDLKNIIRESAELQLSVVDLAPYDYTGDDLYAINKRCSDLALQVIANLQVKSKLDKELTFEFILPSGDELISGVMCNLQCTMKQGSCIGAPSYVEIVVQPVKRENITSNGKHVITPSSGFNAMREVEVDVNVPQLQLEEKQVTITSNGTTIVTPSVADGMSKVEVVTDVPTIEGFDLGKYGATQEASLVVNEFLKESFIETNQILSEYSKKTNWDYAMQNVFWMDLDVSNVVRLVGTFQNNTKLIYTSALNFQSATQLQDTFYNAIIPSIGHVNAIKCTNGLNFMRGAKILNIENNEIVIDCGMISSFNYNCTLQNAFYGTTGDDECKFKILGDRVVNLRDTFANCNLQIEEFIFEDSDNVYDLIETFVNSFVKKIKLGTVEYVSSFMATFYTTTLEELKFSRWKKGDISVSRTAVLSIDSIKYIIFHAMNIANGAVNRTLTLYATLLATWINEVANTTPTADDAELLGVEDWDIYKKEDGTLYTWGEIASLIKDITIA